VVYCTVVYCTVVYYTVLYYTVVYCTVVYCTVVYCTVVYYCHVQGLCVNVCFVLQASDKSDCCMSSSDISSLYAAQPCHVDNLTELLATTDLTRVTFTGQLIDSLVCT